MTAADWIQTLGLAPHPEGGYFRETYRAFQAIVPAGCWYGAAVDDHKAYALVGGPVSPGFDFADFELADREALLARFPQHHGAILRLTR